MLKIFERLFLDIPPPFCLVTMGIVLGCVNHIYTLISKMHN